MTIYIFTGAIGIFGSGSGPSADVGCECTQTYHCINQILNVMSIFLMLPLVNQGKLDV